jgi:asparagine synthase (glutamine-hydrolysing)
MCGIAGVVDTREVGAADKLKLGRALARIARRGPDGEGMWADTAIALGHRRLAIIDLSDAASQPMHCPQQRFVVIYNGEIYNFRELRAELDESALHTSSDTEVLLATYAKWGAACLQRLRGMYSFAIWDRQQKKLFCARDRLGVKPFYYSLEDGRFSFASRPQAVLELQRARRTDIDEAAMLLYLEAGYIPAPLSIFQSIRQLEPGHYLEFQGSELRIQRYWDFAQIEPRRDWLQRSENDLLDELDEILTQSVRLRLISDVPLGAFLSGGIDSSLVVAIMSRLADGRVRTCSIGFTDPRYDESSHAAAVAAHLGTDHVTEKLAVEELLQLMPRFMDEFDEPFFDSSAFATMAVSRLARRHVTVALTGDGGDELFGGYHYYAILKQVAPLFRTPALRRLIAAAATALPGHRPKLLATVLREPDEVAAFARMRSISKDFPLPVHPRATAVMSGQRALFAAAARKEPASLHPVELAMRLDTRFTLPNDYLHKVDGASMAFSLEAREPLLDHELVEWAMRLPHEWKLRNGSKYLLRQLAYRYVPRSLLDRPKKGFEVPIAQWLRGPLREWARERLGARELFEGLPLDPAAANRLFELHLSGKRNVHPLLWAVLILLEFVARLRQPSSVPP